MPDLDHDNTMTTTGEWSTALIELLERQDELVTRLGALADQQAELVQSRRTDALLALLAERQRIIEAFTRAQDELGAMSEDIETRLESVDDERRTRVQTLIADIGDRLAQVMQRDERDQAVLATVRGDIRSELSAIDATRQARAAYRSTGAPTNRFADQRG